MKKHISNFSFSSLPFLIGLLPGFIVIPFYLKTIGAEQLGVYYLYLAFVGIGGTFDLGIPQTIVKYVSEYKNKSQLFLRLTLSSTGLILKYVNLLIIALGVLFYYIYNFFSDSPIGYKIMLIFIIGLILQMWFNFYIAILKGYEDFKRVAKIEILNKLLFTSLGLLTAYCFNNVIYILIAHLFSNSIQLLLLSKEAKNTIHFASKELKICFFRKNLWVYSKWVLVQNTIGFLNGNIDKFIIASFISLDSLAIYNTAKNIANMIPSFFSKGMAYILPHVSQIGDKQSIKNFYIKSSYIFNSFLALVYVGAVIIMPYLIQIYLSGDLETAAGVNEIFRFVLISSLFMATSVLSFNLFNGMGEVRTNTVIPFIGNLCSIILVVVCGYLFGFWGVVLAKMNNSISSIIVRTFTYNRVFSPKDRIIGLKMALPLVLTIVIVELVINTQL